MIWFKSIYIKTTINAIFEAKIQVSLSLPILFFVSFITLVVPYFKFSGIVEEIEGWYAEYIWRLWRTYFKEATDDICFLFMPPCSLPSLSVDGNFGFFLIKRVLQN